MKLELLLGNPIFSLAFGIVGVAMLLPLMIVIALCVAATSDRPRALFRRHSIDNHPLNTVLLFNTRCRIGGVLKRLSLHSLPVLLGLVEGRLTALEFIRTDWSER